MARSLTCWSLEVERGDRRLVAYNAKQHEPLKEHNMIHWIFAAILSVVRTVLAFGIIGFVAAVEWKVVSNWLRNAIKD
jgi:hypothetical protein